MGVFRVDCCCSFTRFLSCTLSANIPAREILGVDDSAFSATSADYFPMNSISDLTSILFALYRAVLASWLFTSTAHRIRGQAIPASYTFFGSVNHINHSLTVIGRGPGDWRLAGPFHVSLFYHLLALLSWFYGVLWYSFCALNWSWILLRSSWTMPCTM